MPLLFEPFGVRVGSWPRRCRWCCIFLGFRSLHLYKPRLGSGFLPGDAFLTRVRHSLRAQASTGTGSPDLDRTRHCYLVGCGAYYLVQIWFPFWVWSPFWSPRSPFWSRFGPLGPMTS